LLANKRLRKCVIGDDENAYIDRTWERMQKEVLDITYRGMFVTKTPEEDATVVSYLSPSSPDPIFNPPNHARIPPNSLVCTRPSIPPDRQERDISMQYVKESYLKLLSLKGARLQRVELKPNMKVNIKQFQDLKLDKSSGLAKFAILAIWRDSNKEGAFQTHPPELLSYGEKEEGGLISTTELKHGDIVFAWPTESNYEEPAGLFPRTSRTRPIGSPGQMASSPTSSRPATASMATAGLFPRTPSSESFGHDSNRDNDFASVLAEAAKTIIESDGNLPRSTSPIKDSHFTPPMRPQSPSYLTEPPQRRLTPITIYHVAIESGTFPTEQVRKTLLETLSSSQKKDLDVQIVEPSPGEYFPRLIFRVESKLPFTDEEVKRFVWNLRTLKFGRQKWEAANYALFDPPDLFPAIDEEAFEKIDQPKKFWDKSSQELAVKAIRKDSPLQMRIDKFINDFVNENNRKMRAEKLPSLEDAKDPYFQAAYSAMMMMREKLVHFKSFQPDNSEEYISIEEQFPKSKFQSYNVRLRIRINTDVIRHRRTVGDFVQRKNIEYKDIFNRQKKHWDDKQKVNPTATDLENRKISKELPTEANRIVQVMSIMRQLENGHTRILTYPEDDDVLDPNSIICYRLHLNGENDRENVYINMESVQRGYLRMLALRHQRSVRIELPPNLHLNKIQFEKDQDFYIWGIASDTNTAGPFQKYPPSFWIVDHEKEMPVRHGDILFALPRYRDRTDIENSLHTRAECFSEPRPQVERTPIIGPIPGRPRRASTEFPPSDSSDSTPFPSSPKRIRFHSGQDVSGASSSSNLPQMEPLMLPPTNETFRSEIGENEAEQSS